MFEKEFYKLNLSSELSLGIKHYATVKIRFSFPKILCSRKDESVATGTSELEVKLQPLQTKWTNDVSLFMTFMKDKVVTVNQQILAAI